MNNIFDTIVIGLGAMGSSAFYHLAQAGQKVLGIDQFAPPHSNGSSHGETRIIRRTTYNPDIYVPLANRAYVLWKKLEKESGVDLLRITGGLMIGRETSKNVQRSIECHNNWGVAGNLFTAGEIRKHYPEFNVSDEEVGFFEEEAGYLILDRCIQAHLDLGTLAGGAMRNNEKVISWAVDSTTDAVIVKTDKSQYAAWKLVLAAGPWSTELESELLPFVKTERQVLHWFEPQTNIAKFSAPDFPVYIWYLNDSDIIYGFPYFSGGRKGVKLALESSDVRCTPHNIDRKVSEEETQRVRDIIRQKIPRLSGNCVGTATCMYSPTTDNNFIVGVHSLYPSVIILAGFLDSGFKFSSAIGEIAKDLIIAGQCSLPLEKLAPKRLDSPNLECS